MTTARPTTRPPGRRRPRYFSRRKVCSFCVDHVTNIDYKDVGKFRRYVSDRYKIESRRKTGTCAKHQRALAIAIKRARHLALLPFCPQHSSDRTAQSQPRQAVTATPASSGGPR